MRSPRDWSADAAPWNQLNGLEYVPQDALTFGRYGFALVLSPTDVLLGRVRRSALETAHRDDRIEPIIEPGPSTIRPHLSSEELRNRIDSSSVRTLVVTTPGGVLLGVVRRDDIPA